MTTIQKQAVFNLVVIGTSITLFLMAIPFLGPARAGGMFGLMGLLGFSVLFTRQRKRKSSDEEPPYDERDWDIQRRAYGIAFGVFWVAFVAACVGAWLIYGDAGAIPVRVLPTILFLSWGMWQAIHSAAVLLQYRWQR